ncbi:MAG: FtsX-like permease family protein [Acidobacteria bacterium]|nr:FtsX-like permease family protein [Acidobacteriota bacterium]
MSDWREEMESHIEMRAEENIRAGMTPAEARRAAERAFGNRGRINEAVRAVTVPVWLEQAGQDLRYALRGLRKSPGFTLTALAALTIGIGASTAVFSFVDRILFRPLPYSNERELVWFGMTAPITAGAEFVLDNDFAIWSKGQTAFSGMTVTAGATDCTLSEENPAKLRCARVESSFLTLFGYGPAAGRDLRPADMEEGAPPVVLISHGLWQRRFGGGGAIGKSLDVDGVRSVVAGVLPENFEMPSLAHVDILQPMRLNATTLSSPNRMLLTAFARLNPGVSIVEARARLEPLFQASLKTVPGGFVKEVKLVIHPLRDRQVRDSRTAALLLLGAVAMVLLIAVANVANLLLARAAARRRELAVRAAIGASAGRLARQALTESAVIGLLGCVLGVGLAVGLLALIRQAAPEGIARLAEATVDWRVAATAAAVSLFAALLFGMAPALRPASVAGLAGTRASAPRREWLRPALVVAQIAMSLMLLCGAGLLLRSLWNLSNVPVGISTTGLYAVHAQLPRARYGAEDAPHQFWTRAEAALAALPGVQRVAIADSLPPLSRQMAVIFSMLKIDGVSRYRGQQTGGMVAVRFVTPNYFSMLQIPVRKGRGFTEADRRDGANVMLISESLAARLFPGGDPVGHRVRTSDGEPECEVVGVVAGVRNAGLTEPSDPEAYMLSSGRRSFSALIEADSRTIPFAREVFRTLDPRLVVEVESLDERVGKHRERPRFRTLLLGGFAVTGLLLAAIGLYGVIALLTAQRTGEIGIRIALGATAGAIRTMVLRQAGAWTLAGVALGLAGAAAVSDWLRTLLFEVKPSAPGPLLAAVAVLLLAAFAAAWLPARRASRVEPVQALREL